jgi:phospholipase D1/2
LNRIRSSEGDAMIRIAPGRTMPASAPPAGAAALGIFEPGRNCMCVARASQAAVLIDGDAYFHAFTDAALKARRSIVILAWDFDSRTRLRAKGEEGKGPDTLGPFLNYLVRRRPGLRIRILDWDYPMIFGTDREFPPIYGAGWTPRRGIELRYDNTHPVGGSHHQKVVVIDDAIAFCGGMDLTNRRWDTCDHLANDPRRTWNESPYPPFHDLMTIVDGDAARALAEIAHDRWMRATGAPLPAVSVEESPWPESVQPQMRDVAVGVSRTRPESATATEIRENEALYLDLIARSQRYIYIENQYFTANRLADALAARLEDAQGPDVVLVLRLMSHGWLEEHTMHALRTRLVEKLRAADRWNRLGIYYPHVPGLREGTCVDVHSKVLIADDEWMRIGSANLCNRSMGMDSECDLTFQAGGDASLAATIRHVRNQLLAEHLGTQARQVNAAAMRSGLNDAIHSLQTEGRTLRRLEVEPWSESVVSVAAIADPERPVALERMIDQFAPNLNSESGKVLRAFLAMIAVVGVLSALWKFTPLADTITADRVIAMAHDFASQPWAPLVVLLAYTPACMILFPRPLITLFSVIAFGTWLGMAYALVGIQVAALATYTIGRRMDRAKVRRFAGPRLNKVSELLRSRGLLAVTALRLVPVAPFAVGGIVAGAIRVKVWHFMLGTLLGMMPGTLAMTVFGDQLEAGLRNPRGINYWIAGGALAAFALVSTLTVRWANRYLEKRSEGRVARQRA